MKGKYAAKATLRREDGSVRSEIETYQQAVKRLTAENEELKTALAAEQATRKQEVRRLKAQLDEGLSPEVITLRRELERQRERAGRAVTDAATKVDIYGRLLQFTAKLLHNLTGCTGLEATERIVNAIRGESITVADASTGAVIKNGKATTVDAEALQRIRGWRSNPKVASHLDAVVQAARGGWGE